MFAIKEKSRVMASIEEGVLLIMLQTWGLTSYVKLL